MKRRREAPARCHKKRRREAPARCHYRPSLLASPTSFSVPPNPSPDTATVDASRIIELPQKPRGTRGVQRSLRARLRARLPDAARFVAASAGARLDAIHAPDYIQKQMTRVTHTIARMQRRTGCDGTADCVMWTHRVRTVTSLGLVCAVSIAKGAPD
jgi:hypothetical protein